MTTGSTVIPCLRYRNAAAAIEWLCDSFGFGPAGPEPEFVSPAAIWSARTGRLFSFRRLVTFAERSLRPQSRRLQACRPMHF